MTPGGDALRVRWLGQVRYRDALAVQRALFASPHDYLLLLEHPHVFTLGTRADPTHVLVDPAEFGTGIEGAVDRYVAMTRATQQLVVLTGPPRAVIS